MRRNLLITIVLLIFGSGKSFAQMGWVWQSFPSVVLGGVFFTDASTGWIAGAGVSAVNNGIIANTTNAGSTWTTQLSWNWVTQQPGVINAFSGISFTDANTGWVDGAEGTIFHTTNGGTSWIQQASGITTKYLSAISFVNASTGWAVGVSGIILYTTNGGTTWKTQISGTTNDLFGLFVSNANTVWAVGESGTILHTTNTGATWVSIPAGTNSILNGVSFVNADTGTIIGGGDGNPLDPATIIHTTDGGVTWENVLQEQTYGLYSIFFVDANHGWASGSSATIAHSSDGGATWQNIPSQYSNAGTGDFLDIFFIDTCTGWTVGDGYSSIAYTTTDFAPAPVPLPSVSLGTIPSARPGDTTIIPVFLQSTGDPFWFSSYSFHLHLNTDLLTPVGFITDSTLSLNAPSTSFSAPTDTDGIDIQCTLSLPLTQLGINLSIPLIYLKAYVTLTDSLETYVTVDSFDAGGQTPLAPCLTPLPVPPPQSSLFQIMLSQCNDSIIFSALSGDLSASFLSVTPNPSYDNSITVTYQLGVDEPIELSVVNARGEQIAILIAGESEPKGTHSIQLSTASFPSGTYFVLLRTANNVPCIAKFQEFH